MPTFPVALETLLADAESQELAVHKIARVQPAAKVDAPPPPPIELSLPGNYEILSTFSYDEPLSIHSKNHFLSAESSGATLEERTFEISQLPDGKSVSIKHVKSGKFMAMKTKSESEVRTNRNGRVASCVNGVASGGA